MRVAIMQPYFFPYIGYFQLMHAVDTFVLFDDVQYIDRGYVNRNRIRSRDSWAWWTLSVAKGARDAAINERHYLDAPEDGERLLAKLRAAYLKERGYSETHRLVSNVLSFADRNVAAFNGNLLRILGSAVGVECAFVSASSLGVARELRGQARIISVCRELGATLYINPVGGIDLYREEAFSDSGLELKFMRTRAQPATLATGPQHMSIVHDLCVGGLDATRARLPEFELLREAEIRTVAEG